MIAVMEDPETISNNGDDLYDVAPRRRAAPSSADGWLFDLCCASLIVKPPRSDAELSAERETKSRGPYEWVADRYDYLRRLCYGISKRVDLVDDLMGEVVDRVPRLFVTHDETKADLQKYVIESLRRYIVKFLVRKKRREGFGNTRECEFTEFAEDSSTHHRRNAPRELSHKAHDRVKIALGALELDELALIVSRYWRGEKYAETASGVGMSTSNVKRICYEAVAKMRDTINAREATQAGCLTVLAVQALNEYMNTDRIASPISKGEPCP